MIRDKVLGDTGGRLKSIAEEYGVSEPTIQMIMAGKTWKQS